MSRTGNARVSVGQAGQLLGVSGGDIRRGTRAKHVTPAQIEQWQAEPELAGPYPRARCAVKR